MKLQRGDPVQKAAGVYGAARRYGGDIEGTWQVLEVARLEKHIRQIAPTLTSEQRAHLILVLMSPETSVAA